MTRRQVLRAAVFAWALSKVAPANAAGQVTVDLNQWSVLLFKFQGRTIRVSPAEVFSALETVKS